MGMWLFAGAALLHCSLDSSGRDIGGVGPGGSAGDPGGNGAGGSVDENGSAGAPDGGASGAGGGAGGAAGTMGAGGGPSAGASGAGGSAGASGSGGSGGASGGGCAPGKGEFAVASAPGSCFFLLGGDAKATPPSGRTSWGFDEGFFECVNLGATLAVLASPQEYVEVQAVVTNDVTAAVGEASLWIGARTLENPATGPQQELAASFQWVNGEPWTYVTPSTDPWAPSQPSVSPGEACLTMQGNLGAEHRMNNVGCVAELSFVLCERALPAAKAGLTAR